ncbi:MAG TPA: class IV adenylate cyclase [Gemmatimonadaceae bacterium]|nr:class IV adenylate cyclase [Gemmatimonadaceae bacterium]
MREVELKAVVDDVAARRKTVEQAGAKLSFEGKISDRRYDFASGELSSRDEVVRLRTYISKTAPAKTYLDWKGPTEFRDVYKVREEIATPVEELGSLQTILEKLGLEVVAEIDREIAQYQLGGATIRFEIYPRMDALVEVEGEPAAIEAAIEAIGIPRGTFSNRRLADFVIDFERRTGVAAAICERDFGPRSQDQRH